MVTQQRLTGIPDDLPPEQLERWSNGLVAFLTSEDVPQQFRAWARQQADVIDEHMASASDLGDEADLNDDTEDDIGEEPVLARQARAASPAPAKTRAARRRAVASNERALTLRIPAESGKLLLGIVIGVVALVAIVGVRQAMSDSGDEPSLPATADAPAFDQARANELEALLNQDPANQDALFELGEMNFQAGRYEDMIPWFTKLVELDPTNKHAFTDLGTAHYNLGQPAEAKIWWEKVLAVDPNDVQAHYNLGFMYANAEPRDLAAAVREWEAVLRLDSESQLAQTARVHIDGLKAELAEASGTGAAGASGTPAATTPTVVAP